MSYSSFLDRVGSKARITGRDGNVQNPEDRIQSPMIKSLRSREIPLITRKWKEKRKVKICDLREKSDTLNELKTEALIKTAQKLVSSSPTAEEFNTQLINATLLKVKNDKVSHKQMNTQLEKEIPVVNEPVNNNVSASPDQKFLTEQEDVKIKNQESALSATDPEDSDTDKSQNRSVATEMETLVAECIYPGVQWTIESLFRVSNLIAPALKGWNPSTFVEFNKRKRVIAPEILKLYNVPIFPKKSISPNADAGDYDYEKNGNFKSGVEDQDVHEASIQILEKSTESVPNTRRSSFSKNPSMPQKREIIMDKKGYYENSWYRLNATDHSGSNKGLTPFQSQKLIESKTRSQKKIDQQKSISSSSLNVESSNITPQKRLLPISRIFPRNDSYENQGPITGKIESSNFDRYIKNSSPVDSIAQSCASSHRTSLSRISLDRSSVTSKRKSNYLSLKLGGLGPDKDNDAYRELLEKKNRQLEYAEQIRRSLAEKIHHRKSMSRPSSATEHSKLPQIVINYSAENVSKGIEKRNRMKEYAQSIKKPLKTQIKEDSRLPDISKKLPSPLEDLHQMEKDHASSMLEVLNIRRQLNL